MCIKGHWPLRACFSKGHNSLFGDYMQNNRSIHLLHVTGRSSCDVLTPYFFLQIAVASFYRLKFRMELRSPQYFVAISFAQFFSERLWLPLFRTHEPLVFDGFLDAATHLYKRVCLSIHLSVWWSVILFWMRLRISIEGSVRPSVSLSLCITQSLTLVLISFTWNPLAFQASGQDPLVFCP